MDGFGDESDSRNVPPVKAANTSHNCDGIRGARGMNFILMVLLCFQVCHVIERRDWGSKKGADDRKSAPVEDHGRGLDVLVAWPCGGFLSARDILRGLERDGGIPPERGRQLGPPRPA